MTDGARMKIRRSVVALLVALAIVAVTAGLQVSAETGVLTAHFISVGQGDSCWLRLPNGDDVLIDGGKPAAGPTVVAYLTGHGVTDIELMVATHPDDDHIGGLVSVLDSMHVEEVWLDSQELQDCTTDICGELREALEVHTAVTTTVRMGQSHAWGDVTALVLNPSEPLYAAENDNSIVVRVSLRRCGLPPHWRRPEGS